MVERLPDWRGVNFKLIGRHKLYGPWWYDYFAISVELLEYSHFPEELMLSEIHRFFKERERDERHSQSPTN